jgi:hypothetical protein
VPIEEYRRVVARCIELGEKLVAAKQDDPATNKWWFDQGKKVADEIYQGEFQPPERERCESCGGSGVWSAAQPGEAVPAEPRCNLCYYKHGHCIGCPNNPVDLALAEKVNAAIEAHRAAPAQAAAVPEAVERDALREVLKQLLLEFGLQETFGIRLARAALSQGDVSGEGEGS